MKTAKAPEVFEENESPLPLATLGDVQRALAKVARQIHSGYLTPGPGQACVNALGMLAKVMQDRRDSLWAKRTEQLWTERESLLKAKTAPVATPEH